MQKKKNKDVVQKFRIGSAFKMKKKRQQKPEMKGKRKMIIRFLALLVIKVKENRMDGNLMFMCFSFLLCDVMI